VRHRETDVVICSYEIQTNGTTVWINARTGECLGRFGPRGIDVHRTVAAQVAGEPECLDCTHTKPTRVDWQRFVAAMAMHHGIGVPDSAMPGWLAREGASASASFSARQRTRVAPTALRGSDRLLNDMTRAAEQVAQWPQWQRDAARMWLNDLARRDPCTHTARCGEAQTCVGGCLRLKRGCNDG
jgi:hypothetical protein